MSNTGGPTKIKVELVKEGEPMKTPSLQARDHEEVHIPRPSSFLARKMGVVAPVIGYGGECNVPRSHRIIMDSLTEGSPFT